MTKTCFVCGQAHPIEGCTVFELTATEEASLVKLGVASPDEVVYCKQCCSILQDPETAPRFMRDSSERQMLKLGLRPVRAREIADRFYRQLIELQRSRRHKIQ